jgi:hypothetical protein
VRVIKAHKNPNNCDSFGGGFGQKNPQPITMTCVSFDGKCVVPWADFLAPQARLPTVMSSLTVRTEEW